MTPEHDDCEVVFTPPPDPDLRCRLEEHPHRIAHQASGKTADGTRWFLQWWDADAYFHDPDGSANHPPRDVGAEV